MELPKNIFQSLPTTIFPGYNDVQHNIQIKQKSSDRPMQ